MKGEKMKQLSAKTVLVYLSIKYKGDWNSIFEAIRKKESFPHEEAIEAEKSIKCNILAITDPEYPDALKTCCKPPFILYYYGDLGCIKDQRRCISYIGSREASTYGKKMAEKISGELASKDYTIVSGMAKGIDGAATRSALNSGGKAVGVLGSGIDMCYPMENQDIYDRLKREGLLISEYPPGVKPNKDNFPFRNRIIAALSKVTIVGEANRRSGTLITVGYALEGGREVACIPFRADEDSACNTLIRDGAALITSTDDVLNLLN